MSLILLPIPSRDFDPSEVAVSWRILTQRGHQVVFATPDGKPGACDPIMLSGIGLDPWSGIPVLRNIRVLGLLLSANADARSAYTEMQRDSAFKNPKRWDRTESKNFDALMLGGGHWARGMREYLESIILQRITAEFFADEKPVAAICHGVLLAARSKRVDGRSVLHGRKTTALTWTLERKASALAHFGRFWDPNYYRTYTETAEQPVGYMSVQEEVTRALASSADFLDVPESDPEFKRKTTGTARDTVTDHRPAWVIRDENYVSARWPGDAHSFAHIFAEVLDTRASRPIMMRGPTDLAQNSDPALSTQLTEKKPRNIMVIQNEVEYTHGWWPNQIPEFLSLADGGPKVRYLRSGRGPALVLLHSIRTQLDLFQRVIPKLTSHFTVYAFDYPGFGWSEIVPGADYQEPAMREHVVNFIKRLDLLDVTLAGESMGATLALTTAAVLGDRVKQVVAFNTYDYLPGVERANLLASVIIKSVRVPVIGAVFAAMESRATLAGILSGGVRATRSLPPDFLDELVKSGKRPGYSKVARAIYRSLPSYVAGRRHYARIDVPVTLVYGDHDWSRPAEREANVALIKHATMIVLKDASHISSLERPEEFARILIETQSTARSAV